MSRVPAERRVWAIVPAAGRGERFSSTAAVPKQYALLRGRPMIEWSIRGLLAEPRIEATVVVVAQGDAHWTPIARRLAGARLESAIGGATRQISVRNGLRALRGAAEADDWVFVHDAARPCLTAREIRDLLQALDGGAAGAVLGVPLVDTIKRDLADAGIETVDRKGLWRALTPQAFRFGALCDALDRAADAGVTVTDEAQAMERAGIPAALVPGSQFNIKVTRMEDLEAAAAILKNAEGTTMRIGQGVDAHKFGDGDQVVLGGVRIPYSKGLIAHSDGDVVIHALCDAILGALGMGDIGDHFPDTDPGYRGADSRVFLRDVAARAKRAGYRTVNADITILAEAPRIAAHRAAMAANLAADLGVDPSAVNIKATTTEKMGFIGRGEGLAALACVLLDA